MFFPFRLAHRWFLAFSGQSTFAPDGSPAAAAAAQLLFYKRSSGGYGGQPSLREGWCRWRDTSSLYSSVQARTPPAGDWLAMRKHTLCADEWCRWRDTSSLYSSVQARTPPAGDWLAMRKHTLCADEWCRWRDSNSHRIAPIRF